MAVSSPPQSPAGGPPQLPVAPPVPPWRRLVAVAAEGVASGTPYMVGSKLLQGWLAANAIPLPLIGLLPLAELPYTLKMFWAPALDRWALPWPDRRRGWILVFQLILVAVIGAMALLRPSTSAASLTAIGAAALVLALASASQDIVIDAYRTDLLPEAERGPGAATHNLGYRSAGLVISSGGFLLAGWLGWPAAFAATAVLMAATIPFTLTAPKLAPLSQPITSLRQAMAGPIREFLHRTGGGRALLVLLLVLLYRWPDGLLNAMAIPFLTITGFSAATIGLIQGAWGIGATIVGTILGGALLPRLGMNRSLWLFALVGAAGNLAYGLLAQFRGGVPALLLAAGLENIGGGMVGAVFVALLMSLCNPRFSATQYALLSGVYALSRSLLSSPAGVLAERTGWTNFFLISVLASLPAFLLMTRITPWNGRQALGAFDAAKDAT
jgi:PAT family beta-lactamase induction signal transducer AmpG